MVVVVDDEAADSKAADTRSKQFEGDIFASECLLYRLLGIFFVY